MLPYSSSCGAAGKDWGVKVKDFIPGSLAGAKGRGKTWLTVPFCVETQNKLCPLDCSWSMILALFRIPDP